MSSPRQDALKELLTPPDHTDISALTLEAHVQCPCPPTPRSAAVATQQEMGSCSETVNYRISCCLCPLLPLSF